jgi:hypothetical protein
MAGSQMMLLTSKTRVVSPIPVFYISDNAINPDDAVAGVTFSPNGILAGLGTGTSVGNNWFSPTTSAAGDNYWIRLTVNSGTSPSSGTTGTWLQLNTNRSWDWVVSVNITITADVTIQIASDSGGTNIVSTASNVLVELTREN